MELSAKKPGLTPEQHLSLTVPRRYSNFTMDTCLFYDFVIFFMSIYIHVVYITWCFAFRMLSAVYVAFSVRNPSLH